MFSSKKKTKKTCVAIVPAAGSSRRMRDAGDKLFAEIRGVPVIAYTLLALESSPSVDAIIIAAREDTVIHIKEICKAFAITKLHSVVNGGKTRSESVLNGILSARGEFDIIAIHDAARPFVSERIITETVDAAKKYGAAAPAVPVKDTIKRAENGFISETVPRETLFAIQTPQVFDCSLITSALQNAVDEGLQITDDCSAAELCGARVFLTKGDYFNIKITTPEDIVFAESISKNKEF